MNKVFQRLEAFVREVKLAPKTQWSWGATTVFSIPFAIGCLVVKNDFQDVFINLSLIGLALVVGWITGIILTPYNPKEREAFSGYMRAISVFISGYLLGKIDPLVTNIFGLHFYEDRLQAFRMIVFLAEFLIALVVTFTYRQYLAGEGMIPLVVLRSLRNRFPKGVYSVPIEKDLEGQRIYDITIQIAENNSEAEATLSSDGNFTEIRSNVAEDKLPTKVTEAIKSNYGQWKVDSVQEVIKVDGITEKLQKYKITLKKEGKIIEVPFDPDGGIVKSGGI